MAQIGAPEKIIQAPVPVPIEHPDVPDGVPPSWEPVTVPAAPDRELVPA